MKLAHAWDHAARSRRTFGRDENDRVAHRDAQFLGQRHAEHDVVAASSEISELACSQVLPDARGTRLFLWQHASNYNSLDPLPVRQQALRLDEWCRSDDARLLLRRRLHFAPIFHRAEAAQHHRMRSHTQDSNAQLPLEPIHDRQHDDQRGDAEHEPEHRDQRNERDETAPMSRAQVTSAYQPLIRACHALHATLSITHTSALRQARHARHATPGKW